MNKGDTIDDNLEKLKAKIEEYKAAIKLQKQYGEMLQKLEFAQKDMLQYASAFNFSNILREYQDILERGSPAKILPREELEVKGNKYGIFYYDRMFSYQAKYLKTFGLKNNDSAKFKIVHKAINSHYIPHFNSPEYNTSRQIRYDGYVQPRI